VIAQIGMSAPSDEARQRRQFWLHAACLLLLLAVSRWWSHATLLLNSDAVNYVRALSTFDLQNYAPHPPGYIFFVFAARAVNVFVRDGNTAYLLVILAAQAIVLLLTLRFLRERLSQAAAFIGTLAVLFHPLFWYYGSVTSVYAAEAASVLAVGWVATKYDRTPSPIIAAVLGIVWGLSGGVRQFTIPLTVLAIALVLWHHRRWNDIWLFVAASIAGVLAWFVPLMVLAGGWAKYRAVTSPFFSYYLRTQSPLLSSDAKGAFYTVIHWFTAMVQLVWPLAPLLFVIRSARRGRETTASATHDERWIWILLIVPSVAFYLLVHIGQSGYVLWLLPPILILIVHWLTPLSIRAMRHISIAFAATAGLGLVAFSAAPMPRTSYVTAPSLEFYRDPENWKTIAAKLYKYQADFSYSGIRKWEGTTRGYLSALGQLPPDSTVAIYIRDREVSAFLWEYYTPMNTLLYRRWPANTWTCRGPRGDSVELASLQDSLVEARLPDRVKYLFVIDDQLADYPAYRRHSPEVDRWGTAPIVMPRAEGWAGDELLIRPLPPGH
jgi:hypothetical protein